MKKLIFTSLIFLTALGTKVSAQETNTPEKFGKTLNLGAGIGYYGSVGRPLPVGIMDFEFDVAKNFTLAPFVGMYSYRNDYYWGNPAA